MEALLSALIERLDITHLALLCVIAAQQWQIRDHVRQASTWATAMERLSEALITLRIEIATRLQ